MKKTFPSGVSEFLKRFDIWLAVLRCFYFSHVFCNLRKLLKRKAPGKFNISDCIFVFWSSSFPSNVFLLLVFVEKFLFNLLFCIQTFTYYFFQSQSCWSWFSCFCANWRNLIWTEVTSWWLRKAGWEVLSVQEVGNSSESNLGKGHRLSVITYRTW